MKELVRKLQSVAAAAALAAARLGVATAANAATAAPGNRAQAATASWGGAGGVRANERVVEAFLQDVINEHHGDHAAGYLNPGMQWSGGTVGTVTGRANVAGLFAGVVAAFPDAHITIDDIFGQADQVVVRVVVSGTQQGAILGIPASGRHVQWDGVDVYRLSHGKISNIWAGDDWTAILNDTGTYKAPWIP
ncbi:MAG TPA: ester cyclase [Streptosporangiaceae bacterium]|nr:ester cyclase [Streptosporangiaceae bacterium]